MADIVVLDGYTLNPGDLEWSEMAALGNLTVYDRTPAELIAERIGGAEIVYTNKTPVTAAVLAKCPNIRFIGVLATGYNVVDIATARERGVVVANIPSYGTDAVAQFAIAMLLEICHHVAHHSEAVRAGRWGASGDFCFWDYPLIELAEKTMGIVGLGRIGQATARIAAALRMRVVAYDKSPCAEGREVAEYAGLDELFRRADVIALHCPLLPETEGLINRDTIGKMKDGVILLNNSRGPLVVEQDLADALNNGKVYAAGLDVACVEPIAPDNPLLSARNCFITPHISWAPRESRQRLLSMAVENLRAFLRGAPINVVNR